MPRNKPKEVKYAEFEWRGKKVKVQKTWEGYHPVPVSSLYGSKWWDTDESTVPLGFLKPGGFNQASLAADGTWKVVQFVSVRRVTLEGSERVVPHSIFRGLQGVSKKPIVPERHPTWTKFRKATGFRSRVSVRLGPVRRDHRGYSVFPKYEPPHDDHEQGSGQREETENKSDADHGDDFDYSDEWGPRKGHLAYQFVALGWDDEEIRALFDRCDTHELEKAYEREREREFVDELDDEAYGEYMKEYNAHKDDRGSIFAEQDAAYSFSLSNGF